MQKWLKLILIHSFIAYVLSMSCASGVFAQNVTGSGVTVTKSSTKLKTFFRVEVALNQDPGTSTATYNPAGLSTEVAGEINTTRFTENIVVQYHVPLLGSSGIDLTVLGKFGTDTNWSTLDTVSISGTTGTNTYGFIDVTEKPRAVRVGVIATGTDGTDAISAWVHGEGWAE